MAPSAAPRHGDPARAGATAEGGIALIVTLLAMALCSAVGAALVLGASVVALMAEQVAASLAARYAAEAAMERALAELRDATDFTSILNGATVSAFTDGAGSGTRTLSGGIHVNLDEVVSQANCTRPSGCSDAQIAATTTDRPWGRRNPRWRLFSFGPLANDDDPGVAGFPVYVVVLVADDPADNDEVPEEDGGPDGTALNPGAGVLLVRAEAFGRREAARGVEATVVRHDLVARARWGAADPATRGPIPTDPPRLEVVGWKELR